MFRLHYEDVQKTAWNVLVTVSLPSFVCEVSLFSFFSFFSSHICLSLWPFPLTFSMTSFKSFTDTVCPPFNSTSSDRIAASERPPAWAVSYRANIRSRDWRSRTMLRHTFRAFFISALG